jgi:hypothetical protein
MDAVFPEIFDKFFDADVPHFNAATTNFMTVCDWDFATHHVVFV